MRKLSGLLTVMAMMALLASSAAAGSWSVTALGGATVPMGDFGDKDLVDAESGFQVGGSLDYQFNDTWAFGVDGSWNKNKHGIEGETVDLGGGDTEVIDKAEFTTIQFGAHTKYMIPMQGSFHPYALLGVGMFKTNYKEEGVDNIGGTAFPYSVESDGDSRLGGKLGLGASWAISSMWAIGAEANYNLITQDKDQTGVDNLQYVGVTAGLTLKFPMGGGATSGQ
jgi:opacity protein-like surface antigen